MSDTFPTNQPEPARDTDAGLSIRTANRLAWSLWAASVVLIALTVLLHLVTNDTFPFAPWERFDPRFAVLTEMLSLAYPTVGTLIVSRLPRNPIGWIFCGVGLLYAAQHFSSAYADYTLIEYSTLPAGEYAAWFSTLINLAGLGLSGVFLTLLFPDGRLLARRWRLVAWAAVFGAAMMVIAEAFMPGPLRTHTYVMNPFEAVGVIGGE